MCIIELYLYTLHVRVRVQVQSLVLLGTKHVYNELSATISASPLDNLLGRYSLSLIPGKFQTILKIYLILIFVNFNLGQPYEAFLTFGTAERHEHRRGHKYSQVASL